MKSFPWIRIITISTILVTSGIAWQFPADMQGCPQWMAGVLEHKDTSYVSWHGQGYHSANAEQTPEVSRDITNKQLP